MTKGERASNVSPAVSSRDNRLVIEHESDEREAGREGDDAGGDEIDLMYDPILNCYYDPKTNKYYELA